MVGITKFAHRFGALALIAGAAVNAHAWIINFGGTYTNPYTLSENLTIDYAFSNGVGNPTVINSISYLYTTGVSNSGSLSASGPLGHLNADFAGNDVFSGGTHTLSGVWTKQAGTTIDSMLTGTYTGTFDGHGDFSFSFVGQPTPEPASYAVLGLGAIGIFLRRRKRS